MLTGKTFFPQLITEPFHSGLVVVFGARAVMMVIGAVAADAPGSARSDELSAPSHAGEWLG